MLTFALTLLLNAALPAQKPVWQELREALDAMRDGKPGQSTFDASLARLPELIASKSGWWVAGGAHLAGQYGRAECVPALLDALKHENERPADGADSAKRAVLDALLRLDARAPVELVMARPEREFANQMYLLLERDTERGRDGLAQLLDLDWIDSPAHWASACALVDARDERVAERLIAGWEWEFTLSVATEGSELWSGSRTCGGGGSSSHELWPPRVSYELKLPIGDRPLQPIEFVRSEAARSWPAAHSVEAPVRAQRRVRLLARLLGDAPERALFEDSEDLRVVLRPDETYEAPLRAHIADLRERIAKLETALRRIGLIEAKVFVAPARVRVRIDDCRDSPAEPLPAPPIVDGVTYEK